METPQRSRNTKEDGADTASLEQIQPPLTKSSMTIKRSTITNTMAWLIQKEIFKRKLIKLVINDVDLTPKFMSSAPSTTRIQNHQLTKEHNEWAAAKDGLDSAKFSKILLPSKSIDYDPSGKMSTMGPTIKTSLEEITTKMSFNLMSVDDVPFWRLNESESDTRVIARKLEKLEPTIKIILKETDDILLYEKSSQTVPKDTEDAIIVDDDNKLYEFLTIGKGRMRRKTNAEAQTVSALYKSRHANTETTKTAQIGSYVSNFDMYDTYKNIEKFTHSIDLNAIENNSNSISQNTPSSSPRNIKTINVTTYKPGGIDQYHAISQLSSFRLATMLTQRILASNIYHEKQKRFRNMSMPDPLDLNIQYLYNLIGLWEFPVQSNERRAVAAMSWCPKNGDILAVCYGVYTYVPLKNQTNGYVCVWSIKNPVNPERRYDYDVPAVSVEFSQFVPQLMAIGFYDGSVEVRDITRDNAPPIAVSQRITSPGNDPITQIRWIKLGAGEELETEPFLTISQDGSIMKYRMVNSPYLLGFQQMRLDRVEGRPEGLYSYKSNHTIESNRHPQALALTVHPTVDDLYFVLTDEGCMHKCSVNYPHQHIDLLKVHEGSVFSMEFSPWSPKLFLTCGSDSCIRIWLDGILEPLIRLSSGVGPVHCAYWSPTHSTIIVGITRDRIEIWDIRRSILQPVSTKQIDNGRSHLTIARFSNCGRSFAVGNERGEVHLLAFEDMPFPPYFQYRELEAAVLRTILAFPELLNEVKSLGYWGYPKSK